MQKSQAEEVNHVRLREPDLEQPCVREEIWTQTESNIGLLHRIIGNWFENEWRRVSETGNLFTGMSCSDRTANLILSPAISYMSGQPVWVWTSTQARVWYPPCAHMIGKRQSGVLRGCGFLCSLATNAGIKQDTCHQPQVLPEGWVSGKATLLQAWLESCLALQRCNPVKCSSACSTSLMTVPGSQSASEWPGCEQSSVTHENSIEVGVLRLLHLPPESGELGPV